VFDIKKMVRKGDEKLFLDVLTGVPELYDMGADRGERQDLVGSRPERVAELRAELESFLRGAVAGESVPPPNEEERKKLEALGY
jgi:hypothetical protein